MNTEKIIADNISLHTREWFLLKTAEECNELSAAIMQYVTKDGSSMAILAEIADVEICIELLSTIMGRTDIESYKRGKWEKIDRKNKELMQEIKD